MRFLYVARQVAIWLAAIAVCILAWRFFDPARSLVQIVATVVVTQTVIFASIHHQRPAAKRIGTWRHIRPGVLIWLVLGLCVPVTLLLMLVYVGTDWSRYPHGNQSSAVLTMAAGFGIGAICAGMQIVTASLRWNDEVVQQRSASFRVKEIAWQDITRTIPSQTARTLSLMGRDGTLIRVPVDAHRLGEFLADAERFASALHDGHADRRSSRLGTATLPALRDLD